MNILYGLLPPDEGEILLDGKPVEISGPSDAIARGIGMVHQHFMLVPVFSVAENIVLGNETMANPVFLDVHKSEGRIRQLATQLGFEIDPDAMVGDLSVGIQQRIEILKALYRGAKILILDEPTAVLTPQETVEIFQVLRRLADEGTSIVFISHKLYEVLGIADRITVIRRGAGRRSGRPQDGDRGGSRRDDGRARGLAHGRQGSGPSRRRRARGRGPATSPTTAAPSWSTARASRSGPARSSASPGSPATARTSWSRRSTGLRRAGPATSRLRGQDMTNHSSRELSNEGSRTSPATGSATGSSSPIPIEDNLVLTDYYHPPFSRRGIINEKAITSTRSG